MKVRAAIVRSVAAVAIVVAGLTTAIVTAPIASADPPGTVQATVAETSGSYLTGFCVAPAHPVLGSPQCSDSTSLLGLTSVSAGAWAPVSLPAGTYTTALADVGTTTLSPVGSVTVTSGQTTGCSYTLAAAPVCGGTGTVVATADEASGSYLTGFCIEPGHPVAGSVVCSDSSSLVGLRSLVGGGTVSIPLPALHYQAALANGSGPGISPDGPVYVAPGRTIYCTFTMSAAPACSTSVATFAAATGTGLVTIAAPDSTYTISAVTNTGPPYSPAPPAGASLPVGVLGFSVTLPAGVTTVDVTVTLPAGSSPTSYFKLHGGTWVDYSSHATIVGDTVTLHLVDGDPFDADGTANGVIVDPGFPSSGYRFSGFAAPIDNIDVNPAKAGQSIPVKWKLVDRKGEPVSDPARIVSLTSQLCKGGDDIKVSPLKALGDGMWQVIWNTDKAFKGQCRTLTLTLNDGTVHVATFAFG